MLRPKQPTSPNIKSPAYIAELEKLCEELQLENQMLKQHIEGTEDQANSIHQATPNHHSLPGSPSQQGPQSTPASFAFENIRDGLFCVDKNSIITYWTAYPALPSKLPVDELVGQPIWDLFPKPAIPLEHNECLYGMAEQSPVVYQQLYLPTNAWFEVTVYPSAEGLTLFFKNITQRKQDEDILRAMNERHVLVAKATNDSVWDWDLTTGVVTRPGNLLETCFGYNPREPGEVDAFWNSHAHVADWKLVNKKRNALLEDPSQNYWEDEYRFLKPDGGYAYVHDRGYIIRDATGKAIRMIGASRDITKEKEWVIELLRIQQNFDSLINSTTDPIWSIDASFRIVAANKAYTNLAATISGQRLRESDPVLTEIPGIDEVYDWKPLYQRALAGEHFNIGQSMVVPGEIEPLHTLVSFLPIRDLEGKVTGVACYQKDVTELKQAGEQLKQLNESLAKRAEELVSSNSELEKFAYIASHDLQEPLRMVTGFLQLLEKKYKGHIDETANRYIHFSVDGAERMKHLINDLLQYSRVGTASLEKLPVPMNEVLNDVMLVFQHDLDSAGVTIIKEPLPVIEAGRSAMSQVLQNLVGNALKYRGENDPYIAVSARELESEWVFTVADNGIGIEEKFREKIFVVFQRLHNKDEYSGTGIGLAICKKIVERYRGKIWVESTLGKGSKFIFTIPKK